jgi:uncharacterized membrane protein YuzA (DUF378 family)
MEVSALYESIFTESFTKTYFNKLIFKTAMVLLIIGGINWLLFGLFNINLVSGIFGESIFATIIYVLVGISAIGIMFDRDTYLPFLGPMVAPCSVLENRDPPGATKEVKVVVEPNVKVLYWAAEPAAEGLKENVAWKKAYLEYQNAGVTTANKEGVAILKVREPQSYTVPIRGKLEQHIHYRVCGEAGWMGRIKTVFLSDNKVEGFESQKIDTYSKSYKIQNLADSAASLY